MRKNGFNVFYVLNNEDAVKKVLDIIPRKALVGIGGSVTLREIDLLRILRERGNKVADHWEAREKGASTKDIMEIRRLHLNSDVFITSPNAVTETGELINIDGGGQRVAAMIFGPKRVIVITGIKKYAKNVEEGLYRVRNIAAPINAKRLSRKTPCAVLGECTDCDSEERICNITTILHRKPRNTDITVILIGEKLGY